MKNYRLGVLALSLISALLISGCASLCSVEMRGGKESSFRVAFSNNDRNLIRNYYAKAKKTPPGLAKKEKLPPGLQKRVVAGEPLPPGLQGRGLPGELENQLSILPSGYIRLKVDKDIIIKNLSTGKVLDVIFDVD